MRSLTPDELPFRVRTGDGALLLASVWLEGALGSALRVAELSGEVVCFEITDDCRLEPHLTVWRYARAMGASVRFIP